MQLIIRTDGIVLSEHLRRFVEKRLQSFTWRFSRNLGEVNVQVGTAKGIHGDLDKYCRIRCSLDGSGLLMVRTEHSDELAAIDLACARISQMIAREVHKGEDRATARAREILERRTIQ